MTSEFILHVLKNVTGKTNPMNQWLSLHDQVQRIGIFSDNNLNVDIRTRQFYFDSNSEAVYIRHLTGNFTEFTGSTIPDGYASVEFNNKTYITKICKPYINNEDIGGFHSIMSFDKIVSFYYANQEKLQSRYLDEIREGI